MSLTKSSHLQKGGLFNLAGLWVTHWYAYLHMTLNSIWARLTSFKQQLRFSLKGNQLAKFIYMKKLLMSCK